MTRTAEICCDFDGTVTQRDSVDLLLDRLAVSGWREIERRWKRGEIGSRECMAGQIPLLRGGWKAIEEVLEEVSLDPTFADFASWCRQSGVQLQIASDGLDRVIHHLLAREGITVESVNANHLVEHADGTLSLAFPHAPEDPGCTSGLCKCQIIAQSRPERLQVVIGDGRSDFCCAPKADLVFARSSLLRHCRETGIRCIPFEDFAEVRRQLRLEIAL